MWQRVPSPGRCNNSELVRDRGPLSGSRSRSTVGCSILNIPMAGGGKADRARCCSADANHATTGYRRNSPRGLIEGLLTAPDGVMVNGSTSLESGMDLVDGGWLPHGVVVPGRSSCPSLPVHASLIKRHQGHNWGGDRTKTPPPPGGHPGKHPTFPAGGKSQVRPKHQI